MLQAVSFQVPESSRLGLLALLLLELCYLTESLYQDLRSPDSGTHFSTLSACLWPLLVSLQQTTYFLAQEVGTLRLSELFQPQHGFS